MATETHAALSQKQAMAVARATRTFASYREGSRILERMAHAIVSLRLVFEKDGRPDFRGETAEYREIVTRLYEETIPDEIERKTFKVAVRYWIGKDFDRRIEAGEIDSAELAAAFGVGTPKGGTRPAASEGNGRVQTEVAQRVSSTILGPIAQLEGIAKELEPLVNTLDDVDLVRSLPDRPLKKSAEHCLELALDAAQSAGVDVTSAVATWYTKRHFTEQVK